MGLFSAIGSIAGGLLGGGSSKKSARYAADRQYQAAQEGIRETARQFDLTRADFASEQQAGEDALVRLRALTGLDGNDAQDAEIMALRESPLYQRLFGSGQDAILASASATGGIRGGNTQAALYEMGEDTLNSVIQKQLADYAGIVGIGTGADGSIGTFGANSIAQQANLRNQGAAAQAQGALVRGGINSQNWANVGTALGSGLESLFKGFKF